MKRWWVWVTVCVVVLGAAVLVYIATRGDRPMADKAPPLPKTTVPKTAVAPRDEPPKPEPKPEPAAPTTFPAAVEWLSPSTYLDKDRRMFSRYDTDGDGHYDANEFQRYGTLRYKDFTSTSGGTPIDSLPYGSTEVFVSTRTREGMRLQQSAKRSRRPDEDTDDDGVADAWEMHWFKSLDHNPYGDEDGDGFPNVIEWFRGTNPLMADILAPLMKPAKLENPPVPKTPWDIRWDVHSREFWKIQDRLRAKAAKEKAKP